MKTEIYPTSSIWSLGQTNLAHIAEKWEETCKGCNPLTPLACVTSCKIWMQKNEFRSLFGKIGSPYFLTNLLNTLKNKRRLQILDVISRGRCSVTKLQQELRTLGYHHSQKTIVNEYVVPLINVGLVEENQENQYYATLFGSRLSELAKNSYDLVDGLPSHSECYEESALSLLMNEPKTFEDFECMIPSKSISRVLERLQKAEFLVADKENDYVFFFRTKRDSNKAEFSFTEKRVYENITVDGISARKLAEKTEISLRRTYKYLRRLKGKKLVFARIRPKRYSLTAKGYLVTEFLNGVCNLTSEIQEIASYPFKDENHRPPSLGA